jgi:pectate lyase
MTSPRFESRFKAISFIFFKRMAAASFFSSVLKTLCPRGKIAIGGLGWLAFFSCGAATLLDDTFADGTLNNVQATNAGTYSVVVNNLAGSATSSNAVLTLNTNAIAPSFVTSPASIITLVGGAVSFSAAASGTAPIYYQWQKNSSPLAGATGNTLNLTNVQNADAGSYSLIASNNVGTATSSAATLTITTSVSVPNSAYNLTGFGNGTTGGGVMADTNVAYRKIYTALDLANAFVSAYKTAGSVKVIEIMNDLDLGWNEVGSAVQTLASTPFRAHNPAQLHPRLLATGVSLIDIKPKSGLTIFSANGATIRHCCFNIKSTTNIIVRNLKFDEMWEWDEASKGGYDKNDWDFIDLGNGGTVTNIWLDHCTFTKTYDGLVDIKQGSSGITISWCKYTGDDGATNTNSWVRQQISSLESNKTSYAMYNFLRSNGFSVEDIVAISQGHDKTHLIGANDGVSKPANALINAQHTITLHHEWFMNPWDRLPRLRGGNVHNYNIYVDDTLGLAAKRLRDTRANAMSTANRNTLNNTYSFNPFLNGSIATESGAVLVEKSVYLDCLTPLRNNQTDPLNPAYTGKILALDTVYQMDSAFFRGNSTDPGGANTLGPVQAPVIPFSWNLPGGGLPYTYTMDDPSQLQSLLAAGAGAGAVTWNKTNWLLTTYAPTAPVIVAQPQNLTLTASNTASFIVVVSGSAPLSYRWVFNTNTFLADATNSSLSLPNVQATNVGTYSVVITNSAGAITSSVVVLTVSSGTIVRPEICTVVFNSGVFSFSVSGSAGQSYLVQGSTNLTDWLDLFTTNPAALPFTWSDAGASNFTKRFYRVQLGP